MSENEMPLHDHFCANVKLRRRELGLTQGQLATKLGVSRPYVTQVETGEHTPTLDVVERFAAALGCSAITLLLAPVTAEAVA